MTMTLILKNCENCDTPSCDTPSYRSKGDCLDCNYCDVKSIFYCNNCNKTMCESHFVLCEKCKTKYCLYCKYFNFKE